VVPALAGAAPQLAAAALACVVVLEAGVALRPLTRELGQRRLGDLIAGTQVIDGPRRPRAGRPGRSRIGLLPPLHSPSRAARQEDHTACESP